MSLRPYLVVNNLVDECVVVVRVDVHGLVESRLCLHHHPLGQEGAHLPIQEEGSALAFVSQLLEGQVRRHFPNSYLLASYYYNQGSVYESVSLKTHHLGLHQVFDGVLGHLHNW